MDFSRKPMHFTSCSTHPSICTLALSPSVKIKVQLWPCRFNNNIRASMKNHGHPGNVLGLYFLGDEISYPVMWELFHRPLMIRIPIKQPSYWKVRGIFFRGLIQKHRAESFNGNEKNGRKVSQRRDSDLVG